MELAPHIVMIGLMGSGKSSIGEPLAARLGRTYVDNDAELQRRTGRDARTLAEESGVDALHAEEAAALLDTLQRTVPAVVGAAASVIDSDAVRDALRDHTVVWLDTDITQLAHKLRMKHHRPYADRDPLELLREQYAERAPKYRQVATIVVHPGERPDEQVADEIARRLQ